MGGDAVNVRAKLNMIISIRTPAWGVTEGYRPQLELLTHFNSHPRVGGDQIQQVQYHQTKFQFAPPRGG